MIPKVSKYVIPHYVHRDAVHGRTQDGDNEALTLLDRQEAVRISQEPPSNLVLTGGKFYCNRRVLGCGRPQLAHELVTEYEAVLLKDVWNIDDLRLYWGIRCFDEKECSCDYFQTHCVCKHVRAAQIIKHKVIPNKSEVPDDDGHVLRSRVDRDVRAQPEFHSCHICSVNCGNAFNYEQHLQGRKHGYQLATLLTKLQSHPSTLRWKSKTLRRVEARTTRRGDCVLVANPDELAQGVVQGVVVGTTKRGQVVHVALNPHEEVTLKKHEVFYVFGTAYSACAVEEDVAEVRPKRSKPSKPPSRSRPKEGPPKKPAAASKPKVYSFLLLVGHRVGQTCYS